MTLLLYLGVVVVERYDLYAVCILETDVKAVVVVNNCTTRAKKAMSLMNDDIIIIIDLILIREGLLFCNGWYGLTDIDSI